MKFALASDIHLEFGPIELLNTEGADVLVLSGDIMVAKDLVLPDPTGIIETRRSMALYEFMDNCCAEFEDVVYVMGNHEHYHGDFATTIDKLREHFKHPNLHILDKQSVTIKDVTFIGGTLWTDMNREDPNTLLSIRGVMNDFRTVKNSNNPPSIIKGGHFNEANQFVQDPWGTHTRPATLMPEDVVADHKAMLAHISASCAAWPWAKFVVVGHHAPSKQSTHPRYKDEVLINGAYSSDLSEFILDRPMIKVWTHGHTHEPFDYMIGTTRIVANPRGYINYESLADRFKLQYIDV